MLADRSEVRSESERSGGDKTRRRLREIMGGPEVVGLARVLSEGPWPLTGDDPRTRVGGLGEHQAGWRHLPAWCFVDEPWIDAGPWVAWWV